jgi:glycosyltransferase involved in cell wall biosynthesis
MDVKQTIYIYRGKINGGGSSKVLKDLILLLNNQNKYNLVLLSHVCADLDIDEDEHGNILPIKNIYIPTNNEYWKLIVCQNIAKHIDAQTNPILISLLDYDSNEFVLISQYILRNDIFWINFDTNHPKIIKKWFDSKNKAMGISYSDLCESVDVIRLENHNFSGYIPEHLQHKIVSFYNTVKIPKYEKINFKKKYNILVVNGLRESRKSIIPFISKLNFISTKYNDFEVHLVGPIDSAMNVEFNQEIERNPNIESYINLQNHVDNIHDYYSSCDFMISLSEYEGTSNAVIEALSHELPVLCLSDCIGVNETIIHNQTGLIFENINDLANGVLDIFKDDEKLNLLKLNCSKIKNQFLDPKLGIEKYNDILKNQSKQHNKEKRKNICDISKNLSESPYLYREKLDAMILYCDLNKSDLDAIDVIMKSEAYAESNECLFIVRYENKKDLAEFQQKYISISKNKLIYKFKRISKKYSKFVKVRTSIEGLVIIKNNNYIQNYCKRRLINVVCFCDCTNCTINWLTTYKGYMSSLAKWNNLDNWIWMIGTNELCKNNCVFHINSWVDFDYGIFTENCNKEFLEDNKIIQDINLPNEIMKQIRNLY